MIKPAVCFEMLYPGMDPLEKIRRIADHGVRAVEFWGWRDKNLKAMAGLCGRLGVELANFSAHRRGSPIAAETHPIFLAELKEAVGVARDLGCRMLMVLSNELGEGGRVVERFDEVPEQRKRGNFIEAMKRALGEVVPDDLCLVIEPLNTRRDHAGNWLVEVEEAASIVDEVGDERLKILCDYYHAGWMGHDLFGLTSAHAGRFGHVHAAEIPGRDEPRLAPSGTVGRPVDWFALFRLLRNTGYDGFVGFEYAPSAAGTDRSLETIRQLWETVGALAPRL
jgi:hydroxypyruvate isomerase